MTPFSRASLSPSVRSGAVRRFIVRTESRPLRAPYKRTHTHLFHSTALALAFAAASLVANEPPLVSFDFETTLVNQGALGGSAVFKTYVAGEDPTFGFGPFGRCLDLTAASRHGGTTPQDPQSGGAVLFRDVALDALGSFTLVLWARQNPFEQGSSARLLQKPGAWDLLALPSGVALSLGSDAAKVPYTLSGKAKLNLSANWCFFAVAVTPQTVAAFVGSRQQPLAPAGEAARHDPGAASTGALTLGNFSGIRPFNGWLDRVRIFRGALDEPALLALFAADLASAKEIAAPQVVDLGRVPATTHRFRLAPSAIPFSTRWQKRENAPEMMQAFHATHCLWVYGDETNFVRRIHDLGIFYQGTLNGLQGQEHSTTNRTAQGDTTGRHEDLDGNKNTPHWMVTFGPKIFTGCCNHPAFRKLFLEDAQRLVAAGVDSIHVDDWEMNASWVRNAGVCFCDACRSGFRDWLARRCTPEELKSQGIEDIATFDYRDYLKANGVPDAATYRARYRTLPLTPQFADFQIESMRTFFKDFRKRLDTWSPDTYIPVSVNGLLMPLRPDHVLYGADVIDFLQGESSQNAEYQTANEYIFGTKIADAAGITQVVSPIPRSAARTRAALATTYALGQPYLVPWDLYMGSDATGIQPRYFGTREQYGDLYDFIREHRDLLDTHVAAAEVGVLVNGDQPGTALEAFCRQLAARQIPFNLILGASRYARVPLRSEDLRPLRLLVEFSPSPSFCAEDQAVLQAARASGQTRFVSPTTDVAARCRLQELDLLRLEGPDNLYAFPRVNRDARSVAIHVVNWNLTPDGERAENYRNVTVTLLHPERWGSLAHAVWHEPGQPSVTLTLERHADCIRLTLTQVATWGIIELR